MQHVTFYTAKRQHSVHIGLNVGGSFLAIVAARLASIFVVWVKPHLPHGSLAELSSQFREQCVLFLVWLAVPAGVAHARPPFRFG